MLLKHSKKRLSVTNEELLFYYQVRFTTRFHLHPQKLVLWTPIATKGLLTTDSWEAFSVLRPVKHSYTQRRSALEATHTWCSTRRHWHHHWRPILKHHQRYSQRSVCSPQRSIRRCAVAFAQVRRTRLVPTCQQRESTCV